MSVTSRNTTENMQAMQDDNDCEIHFNPSDYPSSASSEQESNNPPPSNPSYREDVIATAMEIEGDVASSPFDTYYAPPQEILVVQETLPVSESTFDEYYSPGGEVADEPKAGSTPKGEEKISPELPLVIETNASGVNGEVLEKDNVDSDQSAINESSGESSAVQAGPLRRNRRAFLLQYARLVVWTTQHISRVAKKKALEQKPRVKRAASFAKATSRRSVSMAKETSRRSVSMAKEVSAIVKKDAIQAKKNAKEFYEKKQIGPKTKYAIHAMGNQARQAGRSIRELETKHRILSKSKDRLSKGVRGFKKAMMKPSRRPATE